MGHVKTQTWTIDNKIHIRPSEGPFKGRTIFTLPDTSAGWKSIPKWEDEWSQASRNPTKQKDILRRHKQAYPDQERIRIEDYKEDVHKHEPKRNWIRTKKAIHSRHKGGSVLTGR